MEVAEAERLIVEACDHHIAAHDELLGIMSGMKGNAKFDLVKKNIKAQRKHFIAIKKIFEEGEADE
jgi:hypothetical protein